MEKLRTRGAWLIPLQKDGRVMLIFFSIVLLTLSLRAESPSPTANKLEEEIALKVETLLKKMTLEEKVGQMTQITLDVVMDPSTLKDDEPRLDEEKLLDVILKTHVGSILNVAGDKAHSLSYWKNILEKIKRITKEERLQIPVLYGIDSIHGAHYTYGATIFPQSLAMASSWNTEASRRSGEITALETRLTGIPWNFFPVLDVGRQPLWSRLYETYGEDVYLAQEMGKANILGQQGTEKNQLADSSHVLACMKHFVGYSFPWSGKDRTPAFITEKMMREIFLPTFESAVAAGAETLMVNSAEVDGIPGHANYHLLTEVLKGELGYKGFVVSDWEDIKRLHTRDHLASSPEEAVEIAVKAGVDMSMVPFDVSFAEILTKLVRENRVPMSRIDDAVKRVLRVKFLAGLFHEKENKEPTPSEAPLYSPERVIGHAGFRQESRLMAAESIILLKNKDKVLPLSKEAHASNNQAPNTQASPPQTSTTQTPDAQALQPQTPNSQALNGQTQSLGSPSLLKKDSKILTVGPVCQSLSALNGGWTITWQGGEEHRYPKDRYTIAEAIEKEFGKENVRSFKGTSFNEKASDYNEAIAAAQTSDLIILCLGEKTYTETPGNIDDLDLDGVQIQLAKEIYKSGKPVILILSEGRPRVIRDIVDGAQAILLSFLPGMEGAEAFVDVMMGRINPSAKLPVTYPQFSNSLIPYDHKWQEIKEGNVYAPQWPFGFGLSYSQFSYKNLLIANKTIGQGEKVQLEVDVENSSDVEGQEVVQVYLSDLYRRASTPPVKRLAAFKKIKLAPRTLEKVRLEIEAKQFSFIGPDFKRMVESGEFRIEVGGLTDQVNLK